MNPNEIPDLPLRAIHLPEYVGAWPPGPAWWVVIGILVAAVIGALWVVLRWRRFRLQRAALTELDRIELAYANDANGHRCAQELSRLARRLTLALSPTAAATTGSAWLAVLQELGGHVLPDNLVPVLLEAPYSQVRAAELEPRTFTSTAAVLRAWIAGTRRPARRQARNA